MNNREKIISAIEKAKKQSEEYAQDIIIVPFKEADMILALLKEQEPVKPKQRNPHLGAWWHECGNCDKAISPGDNYCRGCGRAIDWSKIVGVRGSENHKAWEAAQIRL